MKSHLSNLVLALSLCGCCLSCTNRPKSSGPDLLAGAIDSTAKPGDDFFKYALGKWMKQTAIPPDESYWGIGPEVDKEVNDRLRAICQDAAAHPGDLKSTQMIGALWSTGMDSLAVEHQGLLGLKPYLDQINNIKSKADLPTVIARLRSMGVSVGMGFYVGQDDKLSDQYTVFVYQSGLGLPDRDYYFNTDSRTSNIRKEYLTHLAHMFSALGSDSVAALQKSKGVMGFERSLASASRKIEDLRDPYKNYNKYAVAELPGKFKPIEWTKLLYDLNIHLDSIVIGQPEFVSEVGTLINTAPVSTWKDYLSWQLLRKYARAMNNRLVQENFHFYGGILSGQLELRPRWKRILDYEERYAGDLMGQEFVKNYFPPATRDRYVHIVDEMIITYHEHIERLSWMTDSTKGRALVKLSTIRKKIGYPDKWKDYASLSFTADSFIANVVAGEKWLYSHDIEKLGKPVDREEWGITPQTYNAYYNPSNNEIVLPAAIFTIPGLADEDADDALIYGYAAASTVGHELTHGFDDQGSQYDEKGNLKEWWTAQDREQFNAKVKGIVNQFNNYVVLDSMHVNGSATAGENIADLGGVAIGLDAFKKTEQFKKAEKIGGLTPLQRYFLGYTLGWKYVMRDEVLAMSVITDVHAPIFLRVNGPFSNIPEFYEAFNIQPGENMWRPDSIRVKIW